MQFKIGVCDSVPKSIAYRLIEPALRTTDPIRIVCRRFDLSDIPPAPRGVPQIEVSFDIDANGILNVSAKDKATGKAQSIVIKASSGLSDEEVDKMVKDAEAHADEDRKAKELVEARNAADNMIHSVQKSLKDLGAKVDSGEKAAIEKAIEELKEANKADDKDLIVQKTTVLTEAAGKIAEKAYAQSQQAGAAPDSATHGKAGGQQAGKKTDDEVVDAEFEEVKDDK